MLILLPFCFVAAIGQNQFSGTVIDNGTKEPIPFVNITIKDSSYGTISNQDGAFKLLLNDTRSHDTLVFQHIGFNVIKVPTTSLIDGIKIAMEIKQFEMEPVSVVGRKLSADEIIDNAILRKDENYPKIRQKRLIFRRTDYATHVDHFNLYLRSSTLDYINDSLIGSIVSYYPKHIRHFNDHL